MSSQERITQKLFAKSLTAFLLGLALCVDTSIATAAAPADGAPKDDRNIVYRTGPDGRVVATVPANVPDSPAFARFAAWLEKYSQATAEQKPALEAEGVKLATERRKFMAEMIPRDPKRALELAIMPAQRKDLPEGVLGQLEEFVEGDANYAITMAETIVEMPDPEQEGALRKMLRITRTVNFEVRGKAYRPYFYGKRGSVVSMQKMPFYGVSIDKNLAVSESPLRILASGEVLPSYAYTTQNGVTCPICEKESSRGVIGISGGTIYYFDSLDHADEFRIELWGKDNKTVVG